MFLVLEYLELIRRNARFLAFGFLLTFTSSAGQTYFIGIFGPEIRQTFELSHTEWGGLYLIGTLGSALVMPWTGRLIDRVDLRWYVGVVVVGLVIACVSISMTPTILMLTLSIFLLRQFGQGLISLSAITSMARYFPKNRGKAIAVASIGYSVGEAILPFFAVLAIAAIGWRSAYLYTALAVLALLPLALGLLRGQRQRHQSHLEEVARQDEEGLSAFSSKTGRQMLGEPRFYLLLPAVLAPSYILTALFFHHLTLAESKGWSGLWVTGNYWVYAIFSVIASLIAGPMIDKFTAVRVVPFYLTPLVVGLLLLIPGQNQIWVIPYMIFIGLNTGVYHTAINSLWAELYGPTYLGGIKSIIGAFGVFASALGPVTVGVMLDQGFSFEYISIFFAICCVISTILMIVGLKRFRPDNSNDHFKGSHQSVI